MGILLLWTSLNYGCFMCPNMPKFSGVHVLCPKQRRASFGFVMRMTIRINSKRFQGLCRRMYNKNTRRDHIWRETKNIFFDAYGLGPLGPLAKSQIVVKMWPNLTGKDFSKTRRCRGFMRFPKSWGSPPNHPSHGWPVNHSLKQPWWPAIPHDFLEPPKRLVGKWRGNVRPVGRA